MWSPYKGLHSHYFVCYRTIPRSHWHCCSPARTRGPITQEHEAVALTRQAAALDQAGRKAAPTAEEKALVEEMARAAVARAAAAEVASKDNEVRTASAASKYCVPRKLGSARLDRSRQAMQREGSRGDGPLSKRSMEESLVGVTCNCFICCLSLHLL